MSAPKRISCFAFAAGLAWFLWADLRGGVLWTPAFLACLAGLGWLFAEARRPWERRPGAFLFLLSAAVYLSTFRWHGGDDIPMSLVPFALLRDHTFALDRFIGDRLLPLNFTLAAGPHRLSLYPVAPALMALPLYLLPTLGGVLPTEQLLHNLSKVSAALIVAGSVSLLYHACSARASRAWALCIAAFYAFGTWAFSVSSQALYQHGPACLGLSLGLLGLTREGRRWDFLSGLGFGWAVAARPDSVFFAAPAGLHVLFHRARRLPGFALGAAVPAVLLLGYWHHYTGRFVPPEAPVHAALLTGFQPAAFVAMLLSPTRGMLLFSPFLAFGLWACLRREASAESRWLAPGALATWAFVACYDSWVGGATFGTRYFAAMAIVLAFCCAELESAIRSEPRRLAAWCGAGAFSILVHALGGYLTWPGYGWRVDLEKATVWSWSLHPWLDLFSGEGALRSLPWAARAAVAAVLAALGAFSATRLYRCLSREADQPT